MKKWKIEQHHNLFEVYKRERPPYNLIFKKWRYKLTFKTKEEAEKYIKSFQVFYYD